MIVNVEKEYFFNIDLVKQEYPRIWNAFVDEELGFDDLDFLELVVDTVGVDDIVDRLGVSTEYENVRFF